MKPKKLYLNKILNDDKEFQKVFSKWFKLFKLTKEEEEYDQGLGFTKIIEKYNTVKEYM